MTANPATDIRSLGKRTGSAWDLSRWAFQLVNVKTAFGAVGDGVADDTAAITAAIAAVAAGGGGIVYLPAGVYKITATITLPAKVWLLGDGAGIYGAGGTERGVTTIASTLNGTVISTGTALDWGIERLTIRGDRTAGTSQVLLSIGFGTGTVRDVAVVGSGSDGIDMSESLNCDFANVYVASSKRYGLRVRGVDPNANKFTKCRFRTSDEWGVRIEGGNQNHFDTCTIESNNLLSGGTTGGMYVAGGRQAAILTSCYFENNSGAAGTPLYNTTAWVHETGTRYSETRGNQILGTGGHHAASVTTDASPAYTIDAAATATCTFENGIKYGGGSFTVTDNATTKRSYLSPAVPVGYEFNYTQFTDVDCSTGTELVPITVVSAGAILFDGSTPITIEFEAQHAVLDAGHRLILSLWDGTTDLGRMLTLENPDAANVIRLTCARSRRLTPTSGSHTYLIRGFRSVGAGNVTVVGGAGGAGVNLPGFIRITKA